MTPRIAPANVAASQAGESLWLRIACFLLCFTSIAALLAKVYGVASMQPVTLAALLPSSLALGGIWVWANRSGRQYLAAALAIGFIAGLAASLGYDLARVPFHMMGQRIFAPISAYGVWIAESGRSSRFTESIGWAYHLSNGLTFAIMYALFMRNRHWGWAVLWACMLETLAILCPFGRIFSVRGNYTTIAIAYMGHVAYGIPLGLMVRKWDATRDYLAGVPAMLWWMLALMLSAALLGPMVASDWIARDSRAADREFRVEGIRLNPDWLRINRGEPIRIYNPEAGKVSIVVKGRPGTVPVESGKKQSVSFDRPGIYQLYVETIRRSHSSFVIVEPAEARE